MNYIRIVFGKDTRLDGPSESNEYGQFYTLFATRLKESISYQTLPDFLMNDVKRLTEQDPDITFIFEDTTITEDDSVDIYRIGTCLQAGFPHGKMIVKYSNFMKKPVNYNEILTFEDYIAVDERDNAIFIYQQFEKINEWVKKNRIIQQMHLIDSDTTSHIDSSFILFVIFECIEKELELHKNNQSLNLFQGVDISTYESVINFKKLTNLNHFFNFVGYSDTSLMTYKPSETFKIIQQLVNNYLFNSGENCQAIFNFLNEASFAEKILSEEGIYQPDQKVWIEFVQFLENIQIKPSLKNEFSIEVF